MSMIHDVTARDNATAAAPPPPVQAKCGLAIASMVLGLLGVLSCVLGPLFGIPAVVCGHLAMGKIRQSNGTLGGGGLATTGLITGYIGIAMLLIAPILAGLMLPAIGGARERARRINCVANLSQIGKACKMYSMDYRDNLPPSFAVLAQEKYLEAPKVFVCPSTNNVMATDSESFADKQCESYLYFGAGQTEDSMDSATVLAADRDGNHRNFSIVLFGDGHVQGFTGPNLETIVRQNHLRLPGPPTE
ncbi:MAG: DUF4190 domain-containing protein [Lentisphaeria bacterium]|jgi:prepilin-type processing-associated H-X9-DG protein